MTVRLGCGPCGSSRHARAPVYVSSLDSGVVDGSNVHNSPRGVAAQEYLRYEVLAGLGVMKKTFAQVPLLITLWIYMDSCKVLKSDCQLSQKLGINCENPTV